MIPIVRFHRAYEYIDALAKCRPPQRFVLDSLTFTSAY